MGGRARAVAALVAQLARDCASCATAGLPVFCSAMDAGDGSVQRWLAAIERDESLSETEIEAFLRAHPPGAAVEVARALTGSMERQRRREQAAAQACRQTYERLAETPGLAAARALVAFTQAETMVGGGQMAHRRLASRLATYQSDAVLAALTAEMPRDNPMVADTWHDLQQELVLRERPPLVNAPSRWPEWAPLRLLDSERYVRLPPAVAQPAPTEPGRVVERAPAVGVNARVSCEDTDTLASWQTGPNRGGRALHLTAGASDTAAFDVDALAAFAADVVRRDLESARPLAAAELAFARVLTRLFHWFHEGGCYGECPGGAAARSYAWVVVRLMVGGDDRATPVELEELALRCRWFALADDWDQYVIVALNSALDHQTIVVLTDCD
jgi:hypothetical protein